MVVSDIDWEAQTVFKSALPGILFMISWKIGRKLGKISSTDWYLGR